MRNHSDRLCNVLSISDVILEVANIVSNGSSDGVSCWSSGGSVRCGLSARLRVSKCDRRVGEFWPWMSAFPPQVQLAIEKWEYSYDWM